MSVFDKQEAGSQVSKCESADERCQLKDKKLEWGRGVEGYGWYCFLFCCCRWTAVLTSTCHQSPGIRWGPSVRDRTGKVETVTKDERNIRGEWSTLHFKLHCNHLLWCLPSPQGSIFQSRLVCVRTKWWLMVSSESRVRYR